MSLARAVFLSQFHRDIQGLRDALIGLTYNQLIDPSFHPESTLAERLALLAAHYFREGEVLAFEAGQQNDPPLEADDQWHLEAIHSRFDWTLLELQADLEDAWTFYGQMLRDVDDMDYMSYLQSYNGMLPRPAYDLSREINIWRLRHWPRS